MYGIFKFVDIEQFTSGDGWDWDDSIEYVELSARGAALLNVFQKQPKLRDSLGGPVLRT